MDPEKVEWFKSFLLANLVVLVGSTLVLMLVKYPWQTGFIILIVVLTSVIKAIRQMMYGAAPRVKGTPASRPDEWGRSVPSSEESFSRPNPLGTSPISFPVRPAPYSGPQAVADRDPVSEDLGGDQRGGA